MQKENLDILYIEDNPADSFLLERILAENQISIHLDCIDDGQTASDILLGRGGNERRKAPDLILLDLNLPRKNGWQILIEIKADEALAHLPVVILTTSTDAADRARALEMKAHAFFSKPATLSGFAPLLELIAGFCSGRL